MTAAPSLLETMLVHPYSKETVRQFLEDSAKLRQVSRGVERVGARG